MLERSPPARGSARSSSAARQPADVSPSPRRIESPRSSISLERPPLPPRSSAGALVSPPRRAAASYWPPKSPTAALFKYPRLVLALCLTTAAALVVVWINNGLTCSAAVVARCGAAFSRAARHAVAGGACVDSRAVWGVISRLQSSSLPAACELIDAAVLSESDPKGGKLSKLAAANGGKFDVHATVAAAAAALVGCAYDFDQPALFPWAPLPASTWLSDVPSAVEALGSDSVARLLQLPQSHVDDILRGLSSAEFKEKDHIKPHGATYPPVLGVRPDAAAPESTFYVLGDMNDAMAIPAVQRLVLDPAVLRLAQAVLGVAPVLTRVDVWFRKAPAREAAARAAAKVRDFTSYHRDFKLFLYLSDVNASCGPYQYVRGSHASMGPLSLPKDGENYDAADVEGAYPAADRTSVVGPAGTVFAAADAVLHRAAPLSGGPGTHRALLQWEFASSLLGGTDGGFTVPLLRVPARLGGLYASYPRVFSRIKAGYLTVADTRPPKPPGPGAAKRGGAELER